MKIGDFGLSRLIYENSRSLRGSDILRYTDPESLKYPNSYKSDVYSLGILFWEISSGRIPFESDDIPLAIKNGKRETIIEGTPLQYVDIYTGILKIIYLF